MIDKYEVHEGDGEGTRMLVHETDDPRSALQEFFKLCDNPQVPVAYLDFYRGGDDG